MRKINPKFFIFRGDSFDLSFGHYHDDPRLQKAHDVLNDRRFSAKETNISYRMVNHWKSLGILPEGASDSEGWSKFTLLELIWIRIAMKLRDFGMPLESLGEIKEQIMDWHEKTKNYPVFEYYVGKAWLSDNDPYVIVSFDRFAEIGTALEIELSKYLNSIPSNVLQISIKSILRETGIQPKAAKPLHSLSQAEEDLLGAIRMKPNKEIKVKLDDERRITGIEEIEEEINPEEVSKAYQDMKESEAYGEVQIKYVKGKPIHQKIAHHKKYEHSDKK
jgi:DNA-binding transcriptional MerR regulator